MRMKFYCPYCKKVVNDTNNDVTQCITRDGVIRIIDYIHLECNTKLVPTITEDFPIGFKPYQE